MLGETLWEKQDIEWCDHGRQALAHVAYNEGMEFVNPPDEDGELYWVDDGIDDEAERLYIERSYAKSYLPLSPAELLVIARELNEWCRKQRVGGEDPDLLL